MELEIHQLDLRYATLRVLNPRRERKLLASIGEAGQLVPISVVVDSESQRGEVQRYVVLDGFARVRALRRLRRDTVRAVVWDIPELEALLLVRSLRSSEGATALEEAWLLAELAQRFDLDQEDLARKFDRTQGWVSRRLALVRELPESVHDEIRRGRIVPHAAAKYLVPMARANRGDCERLARAISGADLSTRDIGQLYATWRDGSATTRERLIENPTLYLRVRRSAETTSPAREELELRDALLREVGVIGAAVRRAKQRLHEGAEDELTLIDRQDLSSSLRVAQSEIWRLIGLVESRREATGVGSEHKDDDPQAA
jgi:ParB/RepB/Spo0J family partition protein